MTPEEVRRIRHKRGWTQAEMAEALRVALSTVSRWERGGMPITPHFQMTLEMLDELPPRSPGGLFSGERLREFRESRGYIGPEGRKRFAQDVGVHWRSVYRWESGRVAPTKQMQKNLREFFAGVA